MNALKNYRFAWFVGAWTIGAMLFCWTGTARAAIFYSDVVLNSNPVGYWRLDETSGPAVNLGSAGSLLNGTYNNFPTGVRGVPGLITDDPNLAAQFNGVQSSSGSSISASSGMNTAVGGTSNPFANDWTIEAWFVRNAQHQWSGVFSNNLGGTGAPLMTFIDNTHQLGINGAGITANNVSVDLGAGSLGKRVYAAITKTGGNANGTATLSVFANVDGTWLAPAIGTNAGWSLAPQDGYFIGRHFAGGQQYHNGIIDEVAIYDRALSFAEIEQHFLAGASENPPVIPEPSACVLLGLGLVGLATRRRRQRGARMAA